MSLTLDFESLLTLYHMTPKSIKLNNINICLQRPLTYITVTM